MKNNINNNKESIDKNKLIEEMKYNNFINIMTDIIIKYGKDIIE